TPRLNRTLNPLVAPVPLSLIFERFCPAEKLPDRLPPRSRLPLVGICTCPLPAICLVGITLSTEVHEPFELLGISTPTGLLILLVPLVDRLSEPRLVPSRDTSVGL